MVKCAFPSCNNEDGWLRKVKACKYCGESYCHNHKDWKKHFCPKKLSDWTDEKVEQELKKAEEQLAYLMRSKKSIMGTGVILGGLAGLSGASGQLMYMKKELEKNIEVYKRELERRKEGSKS